MKKNIYILTGLVLIQLALIVTTWKGNIELKGHIPGSRLLNFETAVVDTILIKDSEQEIQLTKKDGKWLLPDSFPADPKKVDALLGKLAELQYSLPVATSAPALRRFKLEENNFERYLQLLEKDKALAELYLGTGAGARQSHVRNGKQEAVFTAAIGSYDLPVSEDNWQDGEILQLDRTSITAVETKGLKLYRTFSGNDNKKLPAWQEDSLADGERINQQALNDTLKKLAVLRFAKVLGTTEMPKYGLSEPALSVNLKYQESKRSYIFGKLHESEDFVLKISDRDEFFQIASSSAEPILKQFNREHLITNRDDPDNSDSTKSQK